jgi:dipeptidyl aminopeptidase/acylaminoacyl peptidase
MWRIFALLLLAIGVAHAKRPITHEDVWLMKRLSAPVASPDGKWVVFSVTEPAYSDADQTSDLWLVPSDGQASARKLTQTRAAESGVAWSPDGKRIAFTTRREGDESSQIYLLDLSGGEALRLGKVAAGAASPLWSPDGKWILFEASVYRGGEKEEAARKARKYNARVYDGFPIRYWDHWLDEKVPTLMVMPVDGRVAAKDLLGGSQLLRQAGFGGVNGLASESLQPVWTPDSTHVVFVATTDRTAAAHSPVTTQLYQVAMAGGEPKKIADAAQVSFAKPTFRPDGKALYATEQNEAKVYSLNRLVMWTWPLNNATRTIVAPQFDRSLDAFDFSADSAHVYGIAEEHGDTKIFRAPANGGTFAEYSKSQGTYASLTMAGTVPVSLYERANVPAEVVRVAADAQTNLTRMNAARAEELDLPAVEHFWFTSKKGRRIHNLLVRPPGFDATKKYPVFALIHGGAANMWKDQFFLRWNYHLLASSGYVLVLTDYSGSTGYGEEFSNYIQLDPLKGPGEEINQAVDEALAKYPFLDAARLAAGGASYGGHLANWLQATTTRYKCLISHAGLVNLESQWGTSDSVYHREVTAGGPVWEQGAVWREQNPIRFAAKFRTPILLTVGEKDFRVPLNNTLENWSVLQRLKIPSRLIVFPDANHWILRGEDSRFFYAEVAAWLARWL